MSDIMTPMSFEQLLNWILTEKKQQGTVFGQHSTYRADSRFKRELFGRPLENPIGPAAGPHTQLTQNIVAAYCAGSRFFELKTVQIMDGPQLAACISKPCIKADDEGYNCEWSTELYVSQAAEEYIKAWFLLKIISKEFDLGDPDGFQFNISVGYDLEGIKSEKIDTFLNTMKNAADSEIFISCREYLLNHLELFRRITREDVEAIQPDICNSVTISTLHGCPPKEIERIAMYLMTEKGFHTFIKCNPTLLGYDYVRKTLDGMGYRYLSFTDFHFRDDLQYADALPLLQRLMNAGEERGLLFGVKLTNTFPVDVKQNELPCEEMYLSGKALYPLSMSVAAKLARDFHGKLRISYSGGADSFNMKSIVDAGIWPVTVATTLLKPGGYQRLTQMAEQMAYRSDAFSDTDSEINAFTGAGSEISAFTDADNKINAFTGAGSENCIFAGVDADAVERLVETAKADPHLMKNRKLLVSRKSEHPLPMLNCFTAPCQDRCPIHQDIPAYLHLVETGRYEEALDVIMEKNPLPFITGTICFHKCMNSCTRNFYEDAVHIREMKLLAAEKGCNGLMKKLSPPAITCEEKAAIIGGGPAGMSAAYFLRKGGMDVTIFEQETSLGGAVRRLIPRSRISDEVIEKDISILRALGIKTEFNTKIADLTALRAQGFTHILLALGAAPGKKVPTAFYETCGIHVTAQGQALVNEETLETNLADVYVIGDGRIGPSSVAECIRDGRMAADAILNACAETCHTKDTDIEEVIDKNSPTETICTKNTSLNLNEETIYRRKGRLRDAQSSNQEAARCLDCSHICENCVEVCPNRANVAIRIPGMEMHQILHIDYLCNECGNCRTFCPYSGAPYLDKFTLFASEADLENSSNSGFTVLDPTNQTCKVRFLGDVFLWSSNDSGRLPMGLQKLIAAVCGEYRYLLYPNR